MSIKSITSITKNFETVSIHSIDSEESKEYSILNEEVLLIGKKVNDTYPIYNQLGEQVGVIKLQVNKVIIQADNHDIEIDYKQNTKNTCKNFPILIPLGKTPVYNTSIDPFIIINFANFKANLPPKQKLSVFKTICTNYIDYYSH